MLTIGLLGLSGVGKSFFSAALMLETSNFTCVKASDLLKSASGEIFYNKLNTRNIEHNQKILAKEFTSFKAKTPNRNILIELHNVIETPEGIEFLGEDIFEAIDLTHVVFLQLAPEKLKQQRLNDVSKERRQPSIAELKCLQEKSKNLFFKTFSSREIPLLILESDDKNNLSKFLGFVLSTE